MSNIMLDAALAYAKRGWPIFPCNAIKEPIVEGGVTAATTDPRKVTEWWTKHPNANIGLNVGEAGMMVIDLDTQKEVYDDRAVEALALPETLLRQQSPRGGTHLFYALNPGEIVSPSTSKLAPAVDVRSFNSYVLLAPSRTADGAYVWQGDGPDAKPALRTDAIVAAANAYRAKDKDRDNWIIEPDLPENIALCIASLQGKGKMPCSIAVEGQGGEMMAYKTAAMCKSFGISEALALDLMWEHWNPRCIPPWGADEIDHLETKVRNGYSYNTSPPGNCTPAYGVAKSRALFAPVARELPSGREHATGRFRFVDRPGMVHIRAPEELIPGLVPVGGYGLLIGPRSVYKTFNALAMALEIAAGAPRDPWDHADRVWQPKRFGKVLFCVGEGRPAFFKRVRAWEKRYNGGRPVADIVLADPVPKVMNDEDWDQFIEGALHMESDGFELVIVDTVSRAMAGVSEDKQEYASMFTQRMEQVQRALDCTALGVAHTGHDGERMRGSSSFLGDVDFAVMCRMAGPMMVELDNRSERGGKMKDLAEWDRERFIKLETVTLDDGTSSLVAVKPEPVIEAEARRGKTQTETADAAVQAVLATNKIADWSTKDLAEAVAMRDEVSYSSETLKKHGLARAREQKGSYASKAYDPLKKRWRFVD